MLRFFSALIFTIFMSIGGNQGALAASGDYAFEAVSAKVPPTSDAIISVRLFNKKTGKPVTGAVIFQQRLDMSPDNMADMAANVTPLDASEPGVYRFKADLGMAGRWALKLAAKVPGEQETVRGELVIVAVK